MAEADTGTDQGEELLTLSEVSNRTGISMPTLQRYKKNYQNRIPSVGKGRKQRYPVESLSVFQEIKKENIAKRGRPPKKKSAAKSDRGRKAKAKSPGPSTPEGLLTLTEVAERTNISYPTLVRYVKLHGDRIPYEGKGRRKRYHPEAVEVFQQIRSESPRGRRKGSGKKSGGRKTRSGAAAATTAATDGSVARRLQALERSQTQLTQEIRELVKHLKRPMKATFERK